MNQNKLLERQLKQTFTALKGSELTVLLKNFEVFAGLESERIYSNKGVRCLECAIIVGSQKGTGYGRNEEEATSNCIRSLFENMSANNYRIEQIKQSLRCIHKPPAKKVESNQQQTLDLTYQDLLSDVPSINNISMIQKESCRCGASDTVDQQNKKIANLQARLKLLSQQNSILKELLLKELPGSNKQNRNTINR